MKFHNHRVLQNEIVCLHAAGLPDFKYSAIQLKKKRIKLSRRTRTHAVDGCWPSRQLSQPCGSGGPNLCRSIVRLSMLGRRQFPGQAAGIGIHSLHAHTKLPIHA